MNWKKLLGSLGVVASLLASPAVTDVLSAKVSAIVLAVAYLLKTLTGNDKPADK